jgi:hypothetical protein
MSTQTIIKQIRNIMREDSGLDGDAQRIPQLVWLIFLKVWDDKERENELQAELKGQRIHVNNRVKIPVAKLGRRYRRVNWRQSVEFCKQRAISLSQKSGRHAVRGSWYHQRSF